MRPVHFFILLLALMIVSIDGIALRNDSFAAPKPPGGMTPDVYKAVKNDCCEEATKLETVKFEEGANSEFWGCDIKYKQFSSGKNVDDWYVYTTTKDSEWTFPANVSFSIMLNSAKGTLIAYEVYKTCDSWPMLYVAPTNAVDSVKYITPRVGNTKYLIHVNLVAPPSDGEAIKYTMNIRESWMKPPS
jgi:hypothetical protein